MARFTVFTLLAVLVHVVTAVPQSGNPDVVERMYESSKECSGSAKYNITFENFLTERNFKFIPEAGLVYSPLVAASHSGRISILTRRGYASESVTAIAEAGDNKMLVDTVTPLVGGPLVASAVAAEGPTMPGSETQLEVTVDCNRSYITTLGMVAGSPDWLVFIANLDTVKNGSFRNYMSGGLIIYDAGTDKGPEDSNVSIFTPPGDASVDNPEKPPLNIHPLDESPEDPGFHGAHVGRYIVQKVA